MAESFNTRPPRHEGDRPLISRPRPNGASRGYLSRPFQRRDVPYVERNDPLPPKDPSEVKPKPNFPEVTPEQAFTTQTLGHIVVTFVEADGSLIKSKQSEGYLIFKPRGQGPLTGYFRVTWQSKEAPTRKAVIKAIESSYKLPRDAKLTHVHYHPA